MSTILQYGDNMAAGITQKQEYRDNEKKLRLILEKESLSFSELIKASGLSRAVVNNHLREMESKGIVKKEYKNGKLLNILTKNGKRSIEPTLFALTIRQYLLGVKGDWSEPALVSEELVKFSLDVCREKENLEEQISLMSKRFGAFCLFALIKAVQEENADWTEQVKTVLGFDAIAACALNIPVKDGEIAAKEDVKIIGDKVFLGSPLISPGKEHIEKLLAIMEKSFAEEFKIFESLLLEIKSGAELDDIY